MASRPNYGKAVEGGVLRYVSPTSIIRHGNCNRSYWFRYVAGMPDPMGKAAELGVAIHKRIEWYLKTGEDVLGKHERAALAAGLIPAPGKPGRFANTDPREEDAARPPLSLDILSEGKIDGVVDAAGVPVVGGLDLLDPRGAVPMLVDWKSKSSIAEVAASLRPAAEVEKAESLRAALIDPENEYGLQMLTYAEWFRRKHPEARKVVLRHVYIRTQGAALAGETTTAPVDLARVGELWQSLSHARVDPMRRTAAAKRPEDVAPNLGHCHAYHKPCPYTDVCPEEGKNRGVGDLFNLTVAPSGGSMGLLDKFAKLAPASESFKAQDVVVDSSVDKGSAGPLTMSVPTTPVQENPGPAATTVPMDGAATAPRKRGPGRPKKAEEGGADGQAFAGPARLILPAGSELRVYVGCAPLGVQTMSLYPYTEGVEQQILRALDETLPDVRLSGHEMLSFGKWKAVLAKAVKDSPPPPGHYVVSGMIADEKLQVVVGALSALLSSTPGALVMR